MKSEPASENREYVLGWAAMTKLMHQGYSWSGHERNCCYINQGDSTFANISATSGLDFDDDGRAVAVCDWDLDGDLDLWFRNRTGPQLRFMRNDSAAKQSYLDIQLVGKTCNRDAIGAVVEVHAGGRAIKRAVTCGDGYLSGSSKTLHFGLAGYDRIDHIKIDWPGGTGQTLTDLAINNRYRIEQSSATPIELGANAVPIRSHQSPPISIPASTKLVLRAPLPLPPTLTRALLYSSNNETPPEIPARTTLIAIWAQWCAPCIAELSELADHSEIFKQANLDLVALNIDAPENRAKAETLFAEKIRPSFKPATVRELWATNNLKETLDALLVHVRDQSGDWPLPISLLIDPKGQLQVLYLGPITAHGDEKGETVKKDGTPQTERTPTIRDSFDSLITDVQSYCLAPVRPATRAAYPGRWYFKTPRDFAALSRDLKACNLEEDAAFYSAIAASGPNPPNAP